MINLIILITINFFNKKNILKYKYIIKCILI